MRERNHDEYVARWWNSSDRANTSFDPHFLEEEALNAYSEAVKHVSEPVAAVERAPATSNRLIYHPLFENCSFRRAEEILKERGVGNVIFRPSSKVFLQDIK